MNNTLAHRVDVGNRIANSLEGEEPKKINNLILDVPNRVLKQHEVGSHSAKLKLNYF